jgi:regulator of cell morphogenesis and NO signaling
VCLEKGLRAASVLEQLEAAAATGTNPGKDWNSAPLRDLIQHIVTKHHGYLKTELPRITERLQ